MPRPAVELQGDIRVIGAARLQPPGQRRGDHRQLVTQSRVIVLDDLPAVLNNADQLQRDHQVRLVRRIASERRRVHLGGGEERQAQRRPQAQTLLGGGARGHDHLVAARRIGHPALHHADPVLREVLPIRAALQRGRRLTRDCAAAGRPEGLQRAIKADHVHGAPDIPHPGDSPVYPRRVADARNRIELGEGLHVRGVGTRQVNRKRRLRATSPRHRRHRHAAHHTDQKQQHHVPAPPPAETGPEPVTRLPHHARGQLARTIQHPPGARLRRVHRLVGRYRGSLAQSRRRSKAGSPSDPPRASTPDRRSAVPAASNPAPCRATGCPPARREP